MLFDHVDAVNNDVRLTVANGYFTALAFVTPCETHVIVDGINLVKKHAKPNPMKGVTGGIVEKTMPIHQSNVAIFNAASGKADRVGIKLTADANGKVVRARVYKSTGLEIKAA